MLNKRMLLAAAVVCCGLVLMGAYNRPYRWWNTLLTPLKVEDMNEQPALKAFEPDGLRKPAEGAVAVGDWDAYPDRLRFVVYPPGTPLPEDLAPYANPVEATPESVDKGKELYGIYCYACHGIDMAPTPDKESPVLKRVKERSAESGTPSAFMPFNIHIVRTRRDEYIYGTITQGGALMKRLSYHMSPEERWHVVNYIRSLGNQ